ncbi:methyl-accepting chemotaxis protein [Spirochaeta thermophila]|uniref:Methyl-accepting transducer domain-containing protein n=1 Tax=Winmispira thermophila (strain ATCC 49972 / DSM 6192 / RI 19.B1) TaxID=665571 RepID=E0RU39_WINT6|nr:methyl-accepting chemotaxis protein [Spirochaeta thermophila]ADN01095.1 hypothetical protein STHERM_c01190 [Spirochaeta thermophila DSM 6192]
MKRTSSWFASIRALTVLAEVGLVASLLLLVMMQVFDMEGWTFLPLLLVVLFVLLGLVVFLRRERRYIVELEQVVEHTIDAYRGVSLQLLLAIGDIYRDMLSLQEEYLSPLPAEVEESRSMLDRVFSSETEFAKLIEEERKRIDGLKGVDLKKLLRGVAGFEVISRRYILASLVILGTVVKKMKEVISEKLELSRSMSRGLVEVSIVHDLIKRWDELSDQLIVKEVSQSFQEIAPMREMLEKTLKVLAGDIPEMKRQQEEAREFLLLQRRRLEEFFEVMEKVKYEFSLSMERYFDELKGIPSVVKEISEIAENVKMVSFKLSIEASKAGDRSFTLIARELRTLSEKVSLFAKEITGRVSLTTQTVEKERRIQLEKLEELERIMGESSSLTQELDRYDESVRRISDSFEMQLKRIGNIEEYGREANRLLMRFFEIAQQLVIVQEELLHRDAFVEELMQGLQKHLEDFVSREESYRENKEVVRAILERLKSRITTKRERLLLKDFYRKFLGEEWEEDVSPTDDSIIIF